jgi:hypothetical protein
MKEDLDIFIAQSVPSLFLFWLKNTERRPSKLSILRFKSPLYIIPGIPGIPVYVGTSIPEPRRENSEKLILGTIITCSRFVRVVVVLVIIFILRPGGEERRGARRGEERRGDD